MAEPGAVVRTLTQLAGTFIPGGQLAVARKESDVLVGLGVIMRRRSAAEIRQSLAAGGVAMTEDDDPDAFSKRLVADIGGAAYEVDPGWILWYIAGPAAFDVASGIQLALSRIDFKRYPVPEAMKEKLRKKARERSRYLTLFLSLTEVETMPGEELSRVMARLHVGNSAMRDKGVASLGNEVETRLRELLEEPYETE